MDPVEPRSNGGLRKVNIAQDTGPSNPRKAMSIALCRTIVRNNQHTIGTYKVCGTAPKSFALARNKSEQDRPQMSQVDNKVELQWMDASVEFSSTEDGIAKNVCNENKMCPRCANSGSAKSRWTDEDGTDEKCFSRKSSSTIK